MSESIFATNIFKYIQIHSTGCDDDESNKLQENELAASKQSVKHNFKFDSIHFKWIYFIPTFYQFIPLPPHSGKGFFFKYASAKYKYFVLKFSS